MNTYFSLPVADLSVAAPSMVIGGQRVGNSSGYEVINPATEKVIGHAPACDLSDLDAAIESSAQAFASWRLDEATRRCALAAGANEIRRHLDELAHLLTCEQGKPLAEARQEIIYAARLLEEYASQSFPPETLADTSEVTTKLIRCPLGVTALITPWNFPVGTAVVKIAPALLMGNTAVLKPSPLAPLSPLRMGELLNRHLPPGVLNVISGGDDLGEALVSDSRIAKISLTGAVSTGQRIMRLAANDLKRVTLELGGNDPAIVLPDADIPFTARRIAASAFRNTGQVCSAVKRIYAHESVRERLIHELVAECGRVRLGNGMNLYSTMGPLISVEHRDRVRGLIDESLISGGKTQTPPAYLPPTGFFLAPTVIDHPADDCDLVRGEQFGPVLPVLTYHDISDAIDRSNHSNFGLSASVWTSKPAVGTEIADALECGRVGINGHSRSTVSAPFGGFKHSGLGRELGRWGAEDMSELKVTNVFK